MHALDRERQAGRVGGRPGRRGGAALPPCTGSAAGDFAGGAEAGERRAMPKAYRGWRGCGAGTGAPAA